MRIFFIILFTLLTAGAGLKAEIRPCTTIEEVSSILNKTTPNTLVVFGVENILVAKQDKVLRPNAAVYQTQYYFKLLQDFVDDKLFYFLSIIEEQSQTELVVQEWPLVIANLQKITPFVMAQSPTSPKEMGVIKNFPKLYTEKLHAFGIDFSIISEHGPDVDLTELDHIPDVSPGFYAGILFSENYAKGEALAALLKHYQWKPEQVIYVDYQLNNLRAVERQLKKSNIPFIGILFEESTLFSDTVDEEIADLQYDNLTKNLLWLSDAEARSMLNEKK